MIGTMEMDTSATGVSPTDEELRKLLKPNPSHDEVIKAIESSYGLSNIHIVKELESYDDRNYLVRHGESLFLAKIHNGVESAQFLRSNLPLQELLSASLSETASGDTDVSKTAPSPPQRDAGVSSFKVHLTVSPISSQASKSATFEKSYLGSTEYAKVVLSLPEREKGVSSIDLQNAIFQKLKEPKYYIKSSVPIPVVSKDLSDHSYITTYSFPVISSQYSPCRLAMRLLHWVQGDPMSSCIPMSIETLSQAGVYLGNLCHALDDLTRENHLAVQSSTRYHAWDGKNTLDLEKFTDCIQDPQRRSLVTSVIEAFRKEIGTETQQQFRCGILHGDFNDANIILNDKGRVDGVIDFGDSTNRYVAYYLYS
jgi:Ser/Thr protein kinase RdoA (MazF antagonist)